MNNSEITIGIDLGATRVKGVVIDLAGKVLAQHYLHIENDQWLETVLQTVNALQQKLPGKHLIGISAPGIPNENNTSIAYMPGRLSGLENLNWESLLGQPTWVANDAIAALAAESSFGAARGYKHVLLLTLGTGVGGAILINGQIYQGAFQKAGHAGHISVNHEGEQDITGMPGSLEDAIGNCTVQKRTTGRFQYTHDLVSAAKNGDEFAKSVWRNSIKQLAIGIASLINILSPEAVILGGGITLAGDALFKPLEEFLAIYEWRAGGQRAKILKAEFGDLAGAIGAASFANMQLKKLSHESH